MRGILGRVVSLSHCVDEQLLHCLETGVSLSETTDDGKNLLERLRSQITLGDLLGAAGLSGGTQHTACPDQPARQTAGLG